MFVMVLRLYVTGTTEAGSGKINVELGRQNPPPYTALCPVLLVLNTANKAAV